MIKKANGFERRLMVFLCLCLVLAVSVIAIESATGQQRVPEYSHLSAGLGYGIHYGGIGMHFEFNPRLPSWAGLGVYKYLSMGLGMGVIPGGGLAYLISVRGYPLGRAHWFQPRLSLGYGVVGVLSQRYADPGDERRAEGAVAGVGILLKLGRYFSLDGDALAVFPVDYSMEKLDGGRVRLSTGVRFQF